jgi:CHASE3 domain sensor protein
MSKFNALILSAGLVNIALLFAIGLCFKQVDTERLEQIRARSIVTESSALSKLFNDAGVAIGGYSITKTQLYSDRYKRISEQIPLSLRELKTLVGENNKQRAILGRIETTILDGMKTLAEAKARVDTVTPSECQFRARPVYRIWRQQLEQLSEALNALVTVEQITSKEAKTQLSAATLAYALLILGTILDAAVIVLVLLSSKRTKEIV